LTSVGGKGKGIPVEAPRVPGN